MNVLRELDRVVSVDVPLYVAAGMFDGVHLGHRHVIEQARQAAVAGGGQTWVMTFDPHPLAVLAPHRAPVPLTPLPRKLAILEQLGIDGVWILPFDRALSQTEPEAFIARIRQTLPSLRQLVVGPDWRFGRNAAGGATELRLLAAQYGFEPVISKPFLLDGVRVSSTLIRQAVQAGDFEKARTMLGRPYTLTGKVVHGRQVGRKLGFPTANILPDQVVLPPHGVYAVQTDVGGEQFGGAGYYGHRSMDPEENQTYFVEVYLFDFDRDIYGESIGIRLLSYIRPDQRFASYEALIAQIQRDTESIRTVLTREGGDQGVPGGRQGSPIDPPPRRSHRADGC